MGRPKKATATLESLGECSRAMRQLLLATLDAEKKTADRDRAVAAILKDYEGSLTTLAAKRDDLELQLRNYYMAHLDEVEKDGRRSVQLTNGIMGRRTSPSALKLLNKSWTWAAVREAIRAKWGTAFLRFEDPEPDKDKIKAEILEEQLGECGLKLHQDENFYVELERPAEAQS
jgi:phage host-nuclease inhibitor protein Gam